MKKYLVKICFDCNDGDDVFGLQVIDENTIKIVSTEITRIRYMISAIQGFDVNHATELVIV